MGQYIFTDDFKTSPYWWEAAPRPVIEDVALPARTDVAVIGSGVTGLSAALSLARAGRHVTVIEAGHIGEGASTRNAGFIGFEMRGGLLGTTARYGEAKAVGLMAETKRAFDFLLTMIESEQIPCHLHQGGRLSPAYRPSHLESLAREAEARKRALGMEFAIVPKSAMRDHLGSDAYHGGCIYPECRSFHPGLFINGLAERVAAAGGHLAARTVVSGVTRERDGLRVATSRGELRADQVVAATNAYTGNAIPYLARRVIPLRSYAVVTEELPEDLIQRVLPHDRTVIDTRRISNYMRRTPDGRRILFGGAGAIIDTSTEGLARRLQRQMAERFSDLRDTRIAYSWSGLLGPSFDLLPHIGEIDGIHFATGYSGAALPQGAYLGDKIASRITGQGDPATAFGEFPLETRPYYWGRPWFMPAAMAWYRLQDKLAR